MGTLNHSGPDKAAQRMVEKQEKERRKKAMRQQMADQRKDRRAQRANESMLAWACRSFRVVTVGVTLILGGLEVHNSMMAQVENLPERVLFTALGAWLIFGLVWAGSAIGQMLSLRKNGEGGSEEFRSYRNNVIAYVVGLVLIFLAFMSVR